MSEFEVFVVTADKLGSTTKEILEAMERHGLRPVTQSELEELMRQHPETFHEAAQQPYEEPKQVEQPAPETAVKFMERDDQGWLIKDKTGPWSGQPFTFLAARK